MSRQEWMEKREQLLELGQLMDRCFDAEEKHELALEVERQFGKPLHQVKRDTLAKLTKLFEGTVVW